MAVSHSTSIVKSATVANPTIYNVPATASVETSQALTSKTKKLLIRSRGRAKIQFTFVSGETNTKYITIEGASVYSESDLELTGETIYLRTDINDTIEILEWT